MQQPAVDPYAVRFDVEYPDRELNRVTSFFRVFVAIPILIVLATVSGGSLAFGGNRGIVIAGGLLFAAPLLMIVFRQKYPRWWFDWNLQLLRFENRVGAYLLLLRDEYPATDDEQAVNLEIDYPDVALELNRWLPNSSFEVRERPCPKPESSGNRQRATRDRVPHRPATSSAPPPDRAAAPAQAGLQRPGGVAFLGPL